ncbi:MAG: IspD/TarI family cytidylyltransferase [Termitinemataceae bacterium]|nr:MAG: IspD/TarI family cytidylyltransferase [Termitinemataceae bacterium]
MTIAAVITAAGSSSRFNAGYGDSGCALKKEYLSLPCLNDSPPGAGPESLTVLGAAVSAFALCGRVSQIVITVPQNGENGEIAARAALPQRFFEAGCNAKIHFVPGGMTRRQSVHNALNFLSMLEGCTECAGEMLQYVLIHDGARPWVSTTLINKIIDAAILHKAAIPVLSLLETPKELEDGAIEDGDLRFVKQHLRRDNIASAQTPQAFEFRAILQAHEKAAAQELAFGREWTDDAEIWGAFVGKCAAIAGEHCNKKITFKEDLLVPKSE